MSLAENAVDDPMLLKRIMSTAKPNRSHIGRMMDASKVHLQFFSDSEKDSNFVARKERELRLQRQREYQTAWDVAADRRLQLPVLRTMAPSFTKTADDGNSGMGGTVVGGAGHRTIIGMVPTTETVRRIADDDELISSIRPYRIDAARAARQMEAVTESAPHPDEARNMEPTLRTLASSRLIDAGAVPDNVSQKYWDVASVFSAVGLAEEAAVIAPRRPLSPAEKKRIAKATTLRPSPPKGTSSFLTTQRFKTARSAPGVRHPDIGHYHQRYTQTEPRVVGGYMSQRKSAAPQTRSKSAERSESAETATEQKMSPVSVAPLTVGSSKVLGTFSLGSKTKSFASPPASTPVSVEKKEIPKVRRGDPVFASKTPRKPLAICSAAKDLDYFPYADVRSTVKRTICPVKFDSVFHQPRRICVVAAPAVGIYNVTTDIANKPQRVVCMDRDTGREGHWLNRLPAHAQSPGYVDVSNALNMVRPRIRAVKMAPQISEDVRKEGAEDNTVSIEREPNFPTSVFDRCEALRVRNFSTMTGRKEVVPAETHEIPENISYEHVAKRTPSVTIHPSAPGHAPLHRTGGTEIGDVPSLKWVKPTTERTTKFGLVSSMPPLQQPSRDLYYDTSKRALVEPRLTGNPMIETQVSRDKRAKIFSTAGCGAHVVYNPDLPRRFKLVPLFEKQITKELQFCGHRLQSERWQQKNPRAPGPGHYTVSYRLVE